ncbi:MAG: fluoride efflux transporter CrcB [Streptomycetales bacterium]
MQAGGRVRAGTGESSAGLELRGSRQILGVPPAVLLVIACGGMLGALARYGLAVLWPHRGTAFPWATFTANVVGCLLIGALMVLITEAFVAHRLVRPFLGVGVLGGFTTYSTYAVEAQQLIEDGAAGRAFTYIFATLVAALIAVVIGMATTRLLTRALRKGS